MKRNELIKLALIVGHTLGECHAASGNFPLNTDSLQDQTLHAFLNTEGLCDLSDAQIAAHIMAVVT